MNENRSRTESGGEQNPQKRKKRKPISRVMRFIAGAIMLCVILGCIFTCYLTIFVFDVLDSSEVINLDLDQLKLNYTTIIYAKTYPRVNLRNCNDWKAMRAAVYGLTTRTCPNSSLMCWSQ